MSIMRWANVRSTFASFIEVTLFFCALSVAFFVVCFGVYHVIAQPLAKVRQAERLGEALEQTRKSATAMIDARRDWLSKRPLAEEMRRQSDQARADADADPANQEAVELARQAEQEAVDAENHARRSRRLADDAAEAAQNTIKDAALLMMADPSEAAGKLATRAQQVVESARAMLEAAGQLVTMTTPPEEQADQSADQPAGPPMQLGDSFGRLTEIIDALQSLTDRYVELADTGARTDIQKLVDAGEQAAVTAVRSVAGAVFDDDVESIARATARAMRETVGDNLTISQKDAEIAYQLVVDAAKEAIEAMNALASGRGGEDDVRAIVEAARQGATAAAAREDIIAVADAAADAVRTSRDSVGKIPEKEIPVIVEAVEEAARTALDDVAGTTEDDVLAIAQATGLAVRQAIADATDAADAAAVVPNGQPGQTPAWADELVARFAVDRLAAAKILTTSLGDITEALRAVESATDDVIVAARAARDDIPNAQWRNEADKYIELVGRLEQAGNELAVDAQAFIERIAAAQPQDQAQQADLATEIAAAATAMIVDARAIAADPPPNTWAGHEEVTELITQIEKTMEPVFAAAKALGAEIVEPADDEEQETTEQAGDTAPPEEAAVENTDEDATQPTLAHLAAKLRRAADQITGQCKSTRQAIEERRIQQAKDMVNTIRRIEDLAKQTIRHSRLALAVADAAGRGQVVAGQSGDDSFSQGMAEVRMGRVFQSGFPLVNFSQLFGSLPWWMWVIEGLIYLLILTIYWAPSDDTEMNVCELRAFVLFAAVAVVSALIALQVQGQFLSKPIGLFFEILRQGG